MRLSGRAGDDVTAYKARILARLTTLARTNEILFRASLNGASLPELLIAELDAFSLDERLVLSGPTVALQAAQAVPISLIIHELATNAVKHGALSVAEGTLALAWRIEEGGLARRLVLTWTERNGPPVKPPERRGFGTRLIQDGLARELGGEIVLDYRPEGMSASLIIPLA